MRASVVVNVPRNRGIMSSFLRWRETQKLSLGLLGRVLNIGVSSLLYIGSASLYPNLLINLSKSLLEILQSITASNRRLGSSRDVQL